MQSVQTAVKPAKRGKVRDAAATREKILLTATREFATKGFDGARVDAIVERCKISKNLIYHYFDSKEALFIEVMERAYAAMRDRQNELGLKGENPVDDMHALVTHTIQHFIEEPNFVLLLATENLNRARHIRKSKVILDMFNPLKSALAEILERGKVQGVFRPDADWVDLYVSISGLGSYFISNRYTLSYVLGVDLASRERVASRLIHVPDLIISYLCNWERDER